MKTISVIVPTRGRPSLRDTARSIIAQGLFDGDQIIIAIDGPPRMPMDGAPFDDPHLEFVRLQPEQGDWGNPARNHVLDSRVATGDLIVWQDDDDVFVPGAFDVIRQCAEANPDVPLIFRFVTPDGRVLWRDKGRIERGHIGGHNLVTPNIPDKLGRWGVGYAGDFAFIASTLENFEPDTPVWNEDVIAVCRPDREDVSEWYATN